MREGQIKKFSCAGGADRKRTEEREREREREREVSCVYLARVKNDVSETTTEAPTVVVGRRTTPRPQESGFRD